MGMVMVIIKRFEIFFVQLDPTKGHEIKKTRPCIVISPDELNSALNTVIIAPLTSTIRPYPTRVLCTLEDKEGNIVLEQIRTIDKSRLRKKISTLNTEDSNKVLDVLSQMFSK